MKSAGKFTQSWRLEPKTVKAGGAGRKIQQITIGIFAVSIAFGLFAARGSRAATQGDPQQNQAGVFFQRVDTTVPEGGTVQLQPEIRDTQGNPIVGGNFRFETDNPDVATVDALGLVRAVARGFVTVTARTEVGNTTLSSNLTLSVVRVETTGDQGTTGQIRRDQANRIYTTDSRRHTVRVQDAFDQPLRVLAGRVNNPGLTNGAFPDSLFNTPLGIVIDDKLGRIVVADVANHSVRMLLPTGNVVTVAGGPERGAQDGILSVARFNGPRGVALDLAGNLYVADTENHTIRYIDLARGVVSTVAGSPGQSGNRNGTGAQARFNRPTALVMSSDNRAVIVSDTGNGVARIVTPDGVVTSIGRSSQANRLGAPKFVANRLDQQTGSDFVFEQPESIGTDTVGNIYVGDRSGVSLLLTRNGQFFDRVSLAPASALGSPTAFNVSGQDVVVLNSTGPGLSRVTFGQPEISSVSPDRIPIRTGSTISVTGKNFAPETRVFIDGSEVSDLQFVSSTQVRFTSPNSEASGVQTLTLQHRGGVAQTRFTLVPPDFSAIGGGDITTVVGGSRFVGDGGLAIQSIIASPMGIDVLSNGEVVFAERQGMRIRRFNPRDGKITSIIGTGQLNRLQEINDAPAASTPVSIPPASVVDPNGNVFTVDKLTGRIIRVDLQKGIASVFAGTMESGFSGDGGPATKAQFSDDIRAIAFDRAGNLFVVDAGNNRIRRIDTRGIVTTIAGNGQRGSRGDDGPAVNAFLNLENEELGSLGGNCGVDQDGNFYFCDSSNFVVRRVDARTGIITRVFGSGLAGTPASAGMALFTPLLFPTGVSVAGNGDLIVTDALAQRVFRVNLAAGQFTTVAGTGQVGRGAEGVPATASELSFPVAAVADGAGNVYISDTDNNRVRVVEALTGNIRTAIGTTSDNSSGDGGAAIEARLLAPTDVSVSTNGTIFVSDPGDSRLRATAGGLGTVRTVAGNGLTGFGQQPGVPALSARLQPRSVDFLPNGDLVIADDGNNRIWRVDGNGRLSAIAGSGEFDGPSGNNVPATSVALDEPLRVVVDGAGNIYFTETNAASCRVRRVDARTGILTTVAGTPTGIGFNGDGIPATQAQLDGADGLDIDRNGNLYIADQGNQRVRRVDARTGIITTVAGTGLPDFTGDGGRAVNAALSFPTDVAVDGAGNVFITDAGNLRVRRVAADTGIITTVVGTGDLAYSGDGGPANRATILLPFGLTVDRSGNLLIADSFNNRIRAVKTVAVPRATPGIGPGGGDQPSGDDVAEIEPNDTPQAAQALTGTRVTVRGNVAPGDTASLLIANDRVEDFYRITLTSPAAVSVSLDWTSIAADLDLYLFNSSILGGNASQSLVDFSNDEDRRPETIGPRVLPAGTYYLGVSLFDTVGNPSSQYRLSVTVSPTATARVLQVDDGTIETGFIPDDNIVLNRLTPPSYPATLNQVVTTFNNPAFREASAVNSIVRVIVAVDPNGTGNPAAAQLVSSRDFLVVSEGSTAAFAANQFNVPDVTIDRGDFYVGYLVTRGNSFGTVPIIPGDLTNPQGRSFFSSDGGRTFTQLFTQRGEAVNLLIRAEATLGGGAPQLIGVDGVTSNGGISAGDVLTRATTGRKFKPDSLLR